MTDVTTVNPIIFIGCSNSFGLSPTSVMSSGTWTLSANSLTDVTLFAVNPGGNLLTITLGGFCIITVPDRGSGLTIPNNRWSNATQKLNLNSASAFILNSPGCLGLVGASGTMAAAWQAPSFVAIA